MSDMTDDTDGVVKDYRKALQRVVDEEDSHLDEMPDDATLQVIDEILYTYSDAVDDQLEDLEERIQELEDLLLKHRHFEDGKVGLEAERR